MCTDSSSGDSWVELLISDWPDPGYVGGRSYRDGLLSVAQEQKGSICWASADI